ncbi:hypothetical protein E7T09_00980 [Deinococcus sp. KSM4-11]|uniref:hypothetical protein n=1 Tax=Deinococcus sp. KSM4-11 TaxID=2568654 RepID=UPI0010A2E279|nr:hypothetical protein [Deinococcus sp. KSM4-11]THF87842.1 hypothetical protein E7T09_00980 [Deinococcus sp. KSM4-11]
MTRHLPFLLTLLALTACGSVSKPEPQTGADTPWLTLVADQAPDVSTLDGQALSDLRAVILTGTTGKTTTTGFLLTLTGAAAYSITGPSWVTVKPASGTLKSGQAALTMTTTCPKTPQNYLGTLTITGTAPGSSKTTTQPIILICNAPGSPLPYLYPPVTSAELGSTVSSLSGKLANLSGGKGTVSTLGGTAIVNGLPVAGGATVRNGDLLALRVTTSTQGLTTVAAVTRIEPFTAIFLASTRAVSAPSVLYATPTSLDFLNAVTPQTVTVTRSSTLAAPTVTGTCAGIATVTAGASTSTTTSYTVQPLAAGSCMVTFTSGALHTDLPLTVTTTTVTAH